MRRARRTSVIAIWIGVVTTLVATVSAALLPPGGSVPLTGFAPPGGAIVRNVIHPFVIDDGSGTTVMAGDLHEIVIRKGDGTHVFMWRILNTLVDVPEGIVEAAVKDYTGVATFVEYDPLGLGDAPSDATRTGDGSLIAFDFQSNPIFETEESEWFYVDTDADDWAVTGTITIEVQSGNSSSLEIASPVFDSTPPIAEIHEPTPLQCVCDPAEIYGIADDPQTFDNYVLEYREINSAAWGLITQSFVPVPSPGGLLGVWNIGALPQGYYFIRLTVENTMGDDTQETTIVWVDKQFDNLTFAGPASGTVVGGNVCPNGVIDDHCGEEYTVDFSPDGSNYFPVDPGNPVYFGQKINQTFGVWDSTTVADGAYKIRVTATDPCGHVAQDVHDVIVDNTPPTALITDPVNCQCVEGVYDIYGTADDANLSSWVLQYSGGNNNQWVTIASGNTPVVNGLLGSWDTTALLNCPHMLRLVVSDSAVIDCNGAIHHHSVYLVAVNVGCSDCPGDLNHDGVVGIQDLLQLLANWGACVP